MKKLVAHVTSYIHLFFMRKRCLIVAYLTYRVPYESCISRESQNASFVKIIAVDNFIVT